MRSNLKLRTTEGDGSPVEELQLPAGRDAALTSLFVAYHRRLLGLAGLLVDDVATAEDVVQDAFLGLYKRWGWIREPQAAYDYLRTAVLNGARSQLRRRRVRRSRGIVDNTTAPSAEWTAMIHAEHQVVFEGLAELTARQREVLVLRYYFDQTESEIAAALSISAGSVKQHASRGLAALTARLEASS